MVYILPLIEKPPKEVKGMIKGIINVTICTNGLKIFYMTISLVVSNFLKKIFFERFVP